MQHTTGLYKKIANLHKPEEIEKWRAERKRLYPTKANIERKAAELQEKINRGEKMGLHRNRHNQSKDNVGYNMDNMTGEGFKRSHGTAFGNQQKSNFQRKNIDKNHKKKSKPAPKALPTVEDNRKLKPFAGILDIKMNSDDDEEDVIESNYIEIEDDEFIESKNIEAETVVAEPVVCGALSSLMCDYGSSEDEEAKEITNDTNNVKTQPTKSASNKEKILTVEQKLNVNISSASQESLEITLLKSKGSNLGASFSQNVSCNQFNISGSNFEENCISAQAIEAKTNVADTTQITPGRKESTTLKNVTLKSNEDNHTLNDSVDNPNQSTVDEQTEMTEDVGVDKDLSILKNVEDDDSGPEEVAVVKDEILSTTETIKPKNIIRKKTPAEKKIFRRPKPKLPSTLLHKLLFKEMKQERNRVLQCIRYIRRNNYFKNNY